MDDLSRAEGGEGAPAAVTVVKPRNDRVAYRHLELPNTMQVMVISDPETDKAAAAMDVRVGSFSDPEDIAGLAHFTEHMLFYGSEKYPKEDEYNKFVTEHGGHTNAFTASENTNYHFSVNWDHLPEALDRFAQFFLSPLISADGVDREINAVDSEHSKNLNSDAWRKMQLWKHLSNQSHPFSKFATGNIATLRDQPKAAGIDVHAAMKEFYLEHYSSNLMRLVVYGRESLDELERMTREMFQEVANYGRAPLETQPDVFSEEGFLARVVPEGESSTLEMSWMVPPDYKQYRHSPCHYVSHLLGHEGPGSCFQLLKAKKWVTSLVSGESGLSISAASLFYVKVELTDDGHENVVGVAGIIFQYIKLLQQPGGVNLEIFDELKALAEMNFNFRDKQSPLDVATSMATAMQIYPVNHTLLGMYHVPMEYNEASIREVLTCLTPRKVRIMWSSKKLQGSVSMSEPVYGTSFEQETIPEERMAEWEAAEMSPELFLPEHNPFIPTDFSIAEPDPITEPEVISSDEMCRLWFMPDKTFKTPKVYLYSDFVCAEAYKTPEQAVLTRLWCKLLNDYLSSLTYPAELAGLHYSLNNTTAGFQVTVYGYSHKIDILLDKLLQHITDFQVKDDRFQICKEQLAREYANMRLEQPYQRAMYETSMASEATRWHVDQYKEVLPDLTGADLAAHHGRLVARTYVEVLVIGNATRERASQLGKRVTDAQSSFGSRPLHESQRPSTRIIQIPRGQPLLVSMPGPNPDNENSSIVITFQVEANSMRSTCLAQLLAQLGKPAAFHQLRTVEQLGYIADSTVSNVRLILQSASYTAQHLQDRVDSFLPTLEQKLVEMDEDEFQQQVEELAKAKLERPKRLSMEASRVWREISVGTRVFNRPQAEVEVLRTLTRDDLRTFLRDYLLGKETRKLLCTHIRGSNDNEVPAASGAGKAGVPGQWGISVEMPAKEGVDARSFTLLTDLHGYKRTQALYPSPK